MSPSDWINIPAELRALPQWLLAGPNDKGELKVPTGVGSSGNTYRASNEAPSQWMTFEAAAYHAERLGLGLGFVLTAADPYCCVDLDIKDADDYPNEPHKWTTQEQRERHYSICAHLQSYAEFSRGGKGAHVWCRANIGAGLKYDHVEVYSQERFIVCTGRVIAPLPIAERQEMITNMVVSMRARQQPDELVALTEDGQEEPDEELWRRAATAENAEKFRTLCEGHWERYGYPSQSEADLSLMSMFTFYSRSNEQCRRMFRHTVLGQREKALKDDRYLNLTLRIVRSRQAREAAQRVQFMAHNAGVMDAMHARAAAAAAQQGAQQPAGAPSAAAAPPAPPAGPVRPAEDGGLPWPPGYAGALAQVIYESAPRPVREVAIVAALGFLAGVAGKSWVIPGSGLNMYIVLLARSGVGKEALHSGLGLIVSCLRDRLPAISDFVNFSEFASPQALSKAFAKTSCFVNVSGEWGRKLARLASDKADTGTQGLRTLMTNLYQKSGPTSIVGGIAYSDKEKDLGSIAGVSYSMIGESTPETFYRSLTPSMMEDGFLSRFTIIEHNGDRPPLNQRQRKTLDPAFYDYTGNFVAAAMRNIADNHTVPVTRDALAGAMLDEFDRECDARINATLVENERMLWNRAHLKACRLSALLAVGDSFTDPVVTSVHAAWALDVIRRDVAVMQKRMDEGDVGDGDQARERKLLAVVKEYFEKGPAPSHKIPEAMRAKGLIPRSYLLNRLQHVTVFSSHHLGSNLAIDNTLRSLVDSGVIMEEDKKRISDDFGFRGRCFLLMQVI